MSQSGVFCTATDILDAMEWNWREIWTDFEI